MAANKTPSGLARPWAHHLVSTPILSATSVYSIGAFVNNCHFEAFYVGLCSMLVAAVAVLRGIIVHLHPAALAYLLVVALTAAAWPVYAALVNPYTKASLQVFAVAAVPLGLLYPAVRWGEWRADERDAAHLDGLRSRYSGTAWPSLLTAAGAPGLRLVAKRDTRAGYTLTMELPEDGRIDAVSLSLLTGRIERIGKLRRDSIRVEEGPADQSHLVLIHVAERDVLAEVVPLPDDDTLISCAEPFDIGLHEDGEKAMFSANRHNKFVGVTDSGKSNLINVFVKKLAQCVDTVVWVVDPKGGRMAMPWIQPWLDEETGRPVLDWVAVTRQEFSLMLDVGIAIVDGRSFAKIGGEKVTPSAELPMIEIILDEAADFIGQGGLGAGPYANHVLLEKAKYLARKGRSEAVKFTIASQRGTVTMVGDGDFNSQLLGVVGMGVAKIADAQLIFPDDFTIAASLARMTHQGCMYVQNGKGSRPMPSKCYRIEHHQIRDLVLTLTGRRPELDERSAGYAGEVYAQRWSVERTRDLLGEVPPESTRPAVTPPTAAAGSGSTVTATMPQSRLIPPPPGVGPAWRDGRGNPIRRKITDWVGEFSQIISSLGDVENSDGGERGHQGKQRMIGLIHASGPDGIAPAALAARLETEGVDVARQTLMRWLKEETETGSIRRVAHGQYATNHGEHDA